jgi:histidinol-phosphate aminotransferase
MLDAVQAPYAMATPVVECVENALQAECVDEAARWVSETISERERLSQALIQFRFVRRVWPSAANFILVEVDDAEVLVKHSSDDKVLLRYFGGVLENCVRISIGTPQENDRLLESLSGLEAPNA